MKKLIYIIAGVLFLGTNAASAQKTGHVNSQELVVTLPEYKTAEAEIKRYRDEKVAEFEKMKATYEQKVKAFEQEAPNLAANIKELRYGDIIDMEKRLGEYEQTMSDNLQRLEQKLMEPMIKRVKDAIAKVAKAQGINYVLDTGTLIFFDGGNDLQALVKKELEAAVVPPANNTPANKPAGK